METGHWTGAEKSSIARKSVPGMLALFVRKAIVIFLQGAVIACLVHEREGVQILDLLAGQILHSVANSSPPLQQLHT